MKKIGTYVNGNTVVTIYDDGTKVRNIGENPEPEFPESMDLKITNRCDLRCPMCAECAIPIGSHANLNDPILETIHPYTELAIGGGNPLEHPGLVPFLKKMRDQKVICNITVNVAHFLKHHHFLKTMTEEKLIYGLGISIPGNIPHEFRGVREFPNAVIHTICGYTPMETYVDLENMDLNLLVLGYKNKGEGRSYLNQHMSTIVSNTAKLSDRIFSMKSKFKGIAFDNLAVEQLMLKERMPKEEYNKLYMGNDGEYTMYIDLVTRTYAKSSTHKQKKIDADTVTELFKKVREDERN